MPLCMDGEKRVASQFVDIKYDHLFFSVEKGSKVLDFPIESVAR